MREILVVEQTGEMELGKVGVLIALAKEGGFFPVLRVAWSQGVDLLEANSFRGEDIFATDSPRLFNHKNLAHVIFGHQTNSSQHAFFFKTKSFLGTSGEFMIH